MNRYLLRSLVAVLTFSIGVILGTAFRPAVNTQRHWEYRGCKKSIKLNEDVYVRPSPSVSVDTASTDPVKLFYSQTRPSPDQLQSQKVEFMVENKSGKEIANFLVSYRSTWGYRGHGNEQGRQVDIFTNASTSGPLALRTLTIDCDANESIVVWVSSVEFKDGSRWMNPRHRL